MSATNVLYAPFSTAALPSLAPRCTPKDPYDSQVGYQLDFSKAIQSGATIMQLNAIVILPLTDPPLVSTVSAIGDSLKTGRQGVAINTVLSGGQAGILYSVAAQITTSLGATMSRSIIVPVMMR